MEVLSSAQKFVQKPNVKIVVRPRRDSLTFFLKFDNLHIPGLILHSVESAENNKFSNFAW